MNELEPNKAYKIFCILPTFHQTFGAGYVFYMLKNNLSKVKVQMSPRLISAIGQEGLNFMSIEISQRQFPFLIYRETLPGGYYGIDLVPASEY